jgi:hypothetical protein
VGELSVVKTTPKAEELFGRLRQGKPLGSLGLQLPATPPSPAITRVRVLDDSSDGKAKKVSDFLTRAGFLVQPMGTGSLGEDGPAILHAPAALEQAEVVQRFLPDLALQPVPKRTLGKVVAVVIDSTYAGAGVATPAPGSTPPPAPGEPEDC